MWAGTVLYCTVLCCIVMYRYGPGHPTKSPLKGLEKLRTSRVLKAGMVSVVQILSPAPISRIPSIQVLTIEPGVYFPGFLLDRSFDDPEISRFLVQERINQFRDTGGVR